jgi:hypothetical protein
VTAADKILASFEGLLEPNETPFTQALGKGPGWTVPYFCAKTKKQEVEPYITYYTEIVEVLEMVSPDQEDEEDWGTWQPSAGHIRLSKLANRIGQLAYQEVPNPVYDEAACLAWKEENQKTWTKFEWGTSNLVDVSQTG